MSFIRVIHYRWRLGSPNESARLARVLAASAAGEAGEAGSRGVRVLSALDGGREGLVVFEWETRAALDAHRAATSLERVAPWAVPLLHWRTDQTYEVLAPDPGSDAPA
ncbi:MAG TPA: antibiotic biosynthesis monooxygenase [Chloroflexota bacterium]|jgi:heme-degrading monooxygenase HmoA